MIVAVTMAKNEADIIGATVSHLYAHGIDAVIVADNLSTDGTGDIARDAGAEVIVDKVQGYYQDVKMTRLAGIAANMGAEWVLPFDADEIWYPLDGSLLSEFFADRNDAVVLAWGWDHIVTAEHPGPWSPMRREVRQPLPKVAFRSHPDAALHMGNHGVDRPGPRGEGLGYRHFQYRSADHYARKVRDGKAAYDATNLPKTYGAHWRAAGALDDAGIAATWAEMCAEPGLILDPPPILP